jgi:glutaredoxin 3
MKILSKLALIAITSISIVSYAQTDLKNTCITIYTIKGCPYCTKAKDFLHENNILFWEQDISNHPDKRAQLINETGHKTVPMIFFNQKLIGGYDDLIKHSGNNSKSLN